jgi:hypothetical protein
MDYINPIPNKKNDQPIDIQTIKPKSPKRINYKYEISSAIKNISEKSKDKS